MMLFKYILISINKCYKTVIFIYNKLFLTIMKNLTLRDYKILHELDQDSRASYNHIGKKLRLSPSVVERRIKNLIKKNVIVDFKTIINYKKLGWIYYSIYARFQNITEEKKKEIIEYLKNHPLTGQVLLCDGRWQLIFGFFARDIFELTTILTEFNNKFSAYICEINKIIHTGSHHYYRGYLLNKEMTRESEPFLGGKEDTITIDTNSYAILNFIRQNARFNIVDASEKLKISTDQIRYRIKKLMADHVLIGTWLHLNPQKLNINFYRVLLKLKNIDARSENILLEYLNKHKNVIRTNKVFGSWDYFIDLEIGTEDFRNFIENFTKIFSNNIQEYETLIIYNEINYSFAPIFK